MPFISVESPISFSLSLLLGWLAVVVLAGAIWLASKDPKVRRNCKALVGGASAVMLVNVFLLPRTALMVALFCATSITSVALSWSGTRDLWAVRLAQGVPIKVPGQMHGLVARRAEQIDQEELPTFARRAWWTVVAGSVLAVLTLVLWVVM